MTVHTPRPDLAPGCFASALAYRDDAAECTGCPFSAECAPASSARMAQLRAELGLEGMVGPGRKRVVKAASPAATGFVATLPKKVQALVEQIDKKGLKVGDALRAGTNPFDKPAFLRVAAHLLLKLPGGVDRNVLRAALQHKLGWSYETANSHAAQVFHLMPALGVAEDRNGKMILKKD